MTSMTVCKRWLRLIALAACGVQGMSIASADDTVAVKLVAETRELLDERRKTYQFVPAGKLTEGQEVFYTLRIQNVGAKALTGVAVIHAIPANTRYLVGSANAAGAIIDFSINGKDFLPATALPAATRSARDREIADYTHLRITLTTPLAPKAVLLARFRAEFR